MTEARQLATRGDTKRTARKPLWVGEGSNRRELCAFVTYMEAVVTWLDDRIAVLEAIHTVTPPDPPQPPPKGPDIGLG